MRSRMMRVAALAVALAGCGGQGDHTGPNQSQLIGFSGGSVSIGTGPDTGATATFPPGALAQPVLVVINPATLPAIGGFLSVGPAFTVTPAGIALLNSSTVTVVAPATPPANFDMANVIVLFESSAGAITLLSPNSATSSAVSVSAGTLGTFEAVVVTPIDPAGSMVTIAPASVPADGTSVATITVVVLDTNGVAVPGAAVTLASSGSNNTLSQPGPTDATGKTTATLASTTAETKTISVSVVPLSGGGPVGLQAQPTVSFK
jgi:hypothetical protein